MAALPVVAPVSAEELAQVLKDAASHSRTIAVFGNNTKRLMAGPVKAADVTISTAGLHRVLQYERDDLTISVEAGMSFASLQTLLGRNGQMIALDPPFSAQATIGGIVASNASGPLRRGFGTARDLVIGMTFATLEGKLVRTGGMVVKNVAGLDIGKVMIGSFGTLAVLTSLNFRVHLLPRATRTFLFTFSEMEAAIEQRNQILRSILQPLAIDLVNPPAAARMAMRGYMLLVRTGGTLAVLERYSRELKAREQISGTQEAALWQQIREFPADFLRRQPGGVVLRIATTLTEMPSLLKLISSACIARAASGVTYVYLSSWQGVSALWSTCLEHGWNLAVEFAPDEMRQKKELWLEPDHEARQNAFAMMKKIKQMFDPENLLNAGRLYGRI